MQAEHTRIENNKFFSTFNNWWAISVEIFSVQQTEGVSGRKKLLSVLILTIKYSESIFVMFNNKCVFEWKKAQ